MKTFIYINKFKYYDDFEKNRFFGHPKEGKVYKAIKVEETGIFKVPLRSKDGVGGIVLDPKAAEDHDGPGKWDFIISEVTENNLTELDLSIDDLNIIQEEWVDDYKEVKENIGIDVEEQAEIIDSFEDATEALNIILDNDKDMFFTVIDVISELSLRYKRSSDETTEEIINKITELKNKRK